MINFLFSFEHILNDKILGVPRRWLARNSHYWLSPLIIIGVLLLSVALGYEASSRHLTMILLVLPAVGVLLLFIRWPPIGLIAIIGSIIIPFDGPSKVNATMAVVGLLLGLWLMNMMVLQREVKLVPSKTILPLLIFISVAILAFGVGQLPWYTFAQPAPMGAQLGGLAIFVLSAGAFLLVPHQIRELRWLKWMTWLFLALGALFISGRLIPGLGRFTGRLFIVSAIGSLFWTWLVALAFSQAV